MYFVIQLNIRSGYHRGDVDTRAVGVANTRQQARALLRRMAQDRFGDDMWETDYATHLSRELARRPGDEFFNITVFAPGGKQLRHMKVGNGVISDHLLLKPFDPEAFTVSDGGDI